MALCLDVEERTFHFRKPAATSRGALAARRVCLLRMHEELDNTRVGTGECGPVPGLSQDDVPAFGEVVRDFAARFNALRLQVEDAQGWFQNTTWLDGLPSLRFGVETTLLDWLGGGRGLLWPGDFACRGTPLPTHGLIWMDTAEGIAAQVRAKVESGFRVIKLKVGALPQRDERALLNAIADRYPSVTFRLDANGAFDSASAPAYIAGLEGLPVEFLEQPLKPGRRDAHRRLCANSPVPIALDEELISLDTPDARRQLLTEVRPQAIILKPALLGGFAACDDWIAACHETGVAWWANSLLETAVGHNAICQWVALRGEGRVHGLGTGSLFVDNLPTPIRLAGSKLVSESRCPSVD